MAMSTAKRRRTAYAAAASAKQRRQKIIAIVGFILFLGILAYEIPHTLKLLSHSSSASSAAPPAKSGAQARALPKPFRSAGGDPFATRRLADADPQVGPAGGGHDPFVSADAQAAAPVAAPVVAPAAQPLPQQIVIGTPTKNGVATHGWIVILASIPTREGRSSAIEFARSARRNGLNSISVLNSSNRRPLRGGYWVVYTAPVPSLAEAARRAEGIHSSGYRGAYLRELIEYRSR